MRILVIKLSSLGDLFHALPAVHSLKLGLNAEVDWVVQSEYVDLVNCFTDIDTVIPFYRKSFLSNFSAFFKSLRQEQYDYIIDFQGLLKSALVAKLARGKKVIGPSFHREGSKFFYNEVSGKRNKNRHAVDENMDIVRHLGLTHSEICFPVEFPNPNIVSDSPRVAVLPSTRWETKNWPVWSFVDTLLKLREQKKVSIYLLGGPDDIELCEFISASLDGAVENLAGKTSLVEMGGLLKEMDLVISNDTGPVHMAAAVGTKTLVVFGPTDPLRTGPYGEDHKVVKMDSLDCQPCFSRECRKSEIECLIGVTPETVCAHAINMLV